MLNNLDYSLQSTSLAIDSGTDVGLTTDYTGTNYIYGTPDIGAYEYQPPYTMGTDGVPTSTAVRTYGDEKFRNKAATSDANTGDLSISIPNTDRTQWLDAEISTWDNTGTRHKVWTESSTVSGLTNTIHTIGDLEVNKYYNVKVDDVLGSNITGTDCTAGVCKANSSGKITFTYTGTYSTHTFDIAENTDGNSAMIRTMPPTPPTGGFKVSINNGQEYTSSPAVTLTLTGGPDTAYMSVSNSPDFSDDSWESYATTKAWNLDGNYTVYVKFYTQWGMNSEIVSDTITYRPDNTGGNTNPIAEQPVIKQPVIEQPIKTTFQFLKDLRYLQSSDDIKQLQIFLNLYSDTQLAKSGFGSPGKETFFFGMLTKAGVIKFQEKYAKDILSPWGLTKGTGFVGRTTRAKINELMGE